MIKKINYNTYQSSIFQEIDKILPEFKENFLEKVLKQSVDLDAKLITTEKDFVRLPKKYRNFIEVLRVEMKIENEEKLIRLLIKELNICKD